jgi:signal-transduction protein with cAMP-binding, CBS, and nucleotidyltransferase domain
VRVGSKKKVVQESPDHIARLGPGDYFGETALLNEQPRACSVFAIGHVTCLRLHRQAFNSLVGPLANVLEMNALKRILRIFEILRPLGDRDLERMTAHFEIVDYDAGDMIIERDAPADYFYIVRSGTVLMDEFISDTTSMISSRDDGARLSDASDAVNLHVKDFFGAEVFRYNILSHSLVV